MLAAAFLAMAALGVSMTVAMRRAPDDPEVSVTVTEHAPYDSSAMTSNLETCLAGVEASMHDSTRFDADTTDPRGGITVYYGSDPYAIDGYATAGKLWREFDRARDGRDALITAERENLRRVVSY